MKKAFTLLLIIVSCLTEAEAYMEQYPPFPFKGKNLPPHLEVEELIEFEGGATVKKVEGLQVELLGPDSIHSWEWLRIGDGERIIFETEKEDTPFAYAIYYADLDNNGLKDFIIFSSYHSCGLGVNDRVDILFQTGKYAFSHIHYDTMSASLKDFVDMNGDGVYEVIHTDHYAGRRHNYFVYSIYEIKEAKLRNANKKYPKAFPKFIWFTYKPNDKPSTRITREEKEEYLRTLPEVIKGERR